jgi:hypothetical protein
MVSTFDPYQKVQSLTLQEFDNNFFFNILVSKLISVKNK